MAEQQRLDEGRVREHRRRPPALAQLREGDERRDDAADRSEGGDEGDAPVAEQGPRRLPPWSSYEPVRVGVRLAVAEHRNVPGTDRGARVRPRSPHVYVLFMLSDDRKIE